MQYHQEDPLCGLLARPLQSVFGLVRFMAEWFSAGL